MKELPIVIWKNILINKLPMRVTTQPNSATVTVYNFEIHVK